ncbi:MAG: hypothetical protein KDI06_10470, partial [Calditrichaeota bacterium]|nr:hypothetical protein [Calditrichota bacterium]
GPEATTRLSTIDRLLERINDACGRFFMLAVFGKFRYKPAVAVCPRFRDFAVYDRKTVLAVKVCCQLNDHSTCLFTEGENSGQNCFPSWASHCIYHAAVIFGGNHRYASQRR